MKKSTLQTIKYSSPEMNEALKLRYEVFVEEQNVPVELEIDEYDNDAIHVIYLVDENVVGTLRIVNKKGKAKIGRVAVKKTHRLQGIGAEMLRYALEFAKKNGYQESFLESQTQATSFYEKLGFQAEGDIFMDAGIPHVLMRKKL
jgi:predicted GNAT family N-acyltransferase